MEEMAIPVVAEAKPEKAEWAGMPLDEGELADIP